MANQSKHKLWKNRILAGLLVSSLFMDIASFTSQAQEGSEYTAQQPFRILDVNEMVAEMGAGWNLGNTMDGHTGFTPGETLWQPTLTTQELIDSIHNLGFNTVRIPVTWGTMIDDTNEYTINEAWISRVQDIADYCISQDMYVIINIHHDGAEQNGWLRVGDTELAPIYEKFEATWKNIAEYFKDYDEHLIFESMNEVTGPDATEEGMKKDTQVIMEMNQIFVDTIRATGSNNAQRWLSVPGRYTNIDAMTDEEIGFALPVDTVENRIFASIHYYDWKFGMVEDMEVTTFGTQELADLQTYFAKMVTKFTSQGIPVILGEYGCINKNNSTERAYHVEGLTKICQMDGVVACYWDQGWYDRSQTEPDYSYTLVDRVTGQTIDKAVTDAIIRGTLLEASTEDLSEVVKEPVIIPISQINAKSETIIIKQGDNLLIDTTVAPENTNDVLLWKTQNSKIATVYNGKIRGRGVGMTSITAYSQSGSVEKTFQVYILAAEHKAPATEIVTDAKEYTLEPEKSLYLNASLLPADTQDNITYQSSNEAVASVSTLGKVVAKTTGITNIVMTASSGITKSVKVTVGQTQAANELSIALNVYFNDNISGYFSNETGVPITVTQDGQYTLVFDCETDLSATARSEGVEGLNNLTAIYIKDQAVTEGIAKVTPVESCDIFYDSVVVDGTPLTITQTQAKSALKDSGILDTNDPLNSWDGSSVAEVAVDLESHVLNITRINNPQKVEVTFTLSNLVFQEAKTVETTQISTITPMDNEHVTLTLFGEQALLTAALATEDTFAANESVTFVSADSSIACIEPGVVTSDEQGNVIQTVTAISSGTTTITAIADNQVSAVFKVEVTLAKEPVADESYATQVQETKTSLDLVDNTVHKSMIVTYVIAIGGAIIILVLAIVLGGLVFSVKRKKAMEEEKNRENGV